MTHPRGIKPPWLNGPRPKPAADRFWAQVNKDGPEPSYRPDLGPCWLWTGAVSSSGYGGFVVSRELGMKTAHSYAWQERNGAIPDGFEVDHICRVPLCCNPDHLEAVSRSVNQQRGVGPDRSRERQLRKTHCPRGHAYVGTNLILHKNGSRGCRTCRTEWKKLRRRYAAGFPAAMAAFAAAHPGAELRVALADVPHHFATIKSGVSALTKRACSRPLLVGYRIVADGDTARVYPSEAA